MKYDKIYDEWQEFTNKYKEYFITEEEYWCLMLSKVTKYIDIYKCRPDDTSNETKLLKKWIETQQLIIRNREGIMKSNEIFNKWQTFIEKYKEYFMTNEQKWYMMISKLCEYIDKYKCTPSYCSTDDIGILGRWFAKQKIYSKEPRQYIMKNDEIYNAWNNFTTTYKQYIKKTVIVKGKPAIQSSA